jgi:hypothetical protein
MVQLGAYIAARKDQFIETRKKEPEDFLPLSEKKMRIFFENELKPIQKIIWKNPQRNFFLPKKKWILIKNS